MIVVDASVAIKWLRPEAGDADAEALLARPERLAAPSIIHIEVTAGLLRMYRLKELSKPETQRAMRRWDTFIADGDITLVPLEELFDEAVAISFETRHNFQDCLYVAAGRRLGGSLVTADHTLHRRCRTAFDRIELLPSLVEH